MDRSITGCGLMFAVMTTMTVGWTFEDKAASDTFYYLPLHDHYPGVNQNSGYSAKFFDELVPSS